MDAKNIKELAAKYSFEELQEFANKFEQTGIAPVKTSEDPGDQMSDYLMASEVRYFMDENKMNLQEALREFSKRVRGVLK